MPLDFAARVDIGPRETNDDRLLVDGQVLDRSFHYGQTTIPAVVAVCDGCGGYAGGGIAAQTVLELLSFEEPAGLTDATYLAQVLAQCSRAVTERQSELPQYATMCTTIAGCVFGEDTLHIFHAGDSRVYRMDEWGLARMTMDHSAVQDMIRMGQLTEDEAADHPSRHIINRCIGTPCLPPDIYTSRVPIQPGEKYILCSDGLWESLPPTELEAILADDLTPAAMADRLVERAKQCGANDNISVCICVGREAAPADTAPIAVEEDTPHEHG